MRKNISRFLTTLLLPPAALWRLWREPTAGWLRKVCGTAVLLVYSLVYLVAVALLLVHAGLLEIEWRGGMGPVLTTHKTLPDYDALEKHRARQTGPVAAITTVPAEPSAPYWTDFRGPQRDGHYTERPILTNWPAGGPPRLWKQPIGGGYASFVVAGGRAFTIEQRRDHEAVTAYAVANGREIWAHAYPARFEESMGGEGPRATPTWHEGRLYSLGAQGQLICFEAATGGVHWAHNILKEFNARNLPYALSGAPLIVDDTVVVQTGEGAQTLLAFHKETGALAWRAMAERQAYASPMLVTLAGQRQIVLLTGARAVGVRPDNGAELWACPWPTQYRNNIAQPVQLGPDRLFISAGYGMGCAALQLVNTNDGLVVRERWRNRNLKNKFSSSVFWEGHIYGLDESILTCLDAVTGERNWKDGRYDHGQLLLASGHLIVLCGNGDLALVRATPGGHQELARVPALTGKTWNHPALADGLLLVRNAVEMACYDLRAGEGVAE